MPEINALAVIVGLAVLVIGPGGSVYVGLRAALKAERELREMATQELERRGERIEKAVVGILKEMRDLNHRTTKSEAHIEGLERREDG